MIRVVIVLLIAVSFKSFSQDIPTFRPLRFDEDYSFLKDDSTKSAYKKIKFVQILADRRFFISSGGDLRFQYFYVKNEEWGDAPKDKDGYALARMLLHTDLHIGPSFRTFVELQSSLSGSRINPSPVDENPLDLHQAFIDFKKKLSNEVTTTLRVGRQEFLYGSQRLIGVREGPNNRQSFDAIRLLLMTNNLKADFFYSQFVAAQNKIFDDAFNKYMRLWGVYFVGNKIPLFANIDMYYLGLRKEPAVFDDGRGRELRHSVGARIWDNVGDWHYDMEGLYQFGKFADKTILAWTASVNTSYHFNKKKFKPTLGLKTELISGDRHYNDSRLQTFNPLFPRGAYFGLAALVGPSNLIDVHPFITISVFKTVELGWDYDIFWRYSKRDGLYGVNGSLIYSGKNIPADFIGDQLAFNVNFVPNNFFSFTAEFTWFDAGSFLKMGGAGKDILFAGVTTQLRF